MQDKTRQDKTRLIKGVYIMDLMNVGVSKKYEIGNKLGFKDGT